MQQPIRFVPLVASDRLPSQVRAVPADLGQRVIVSKAAHNRERISGLEAPDSAELPIAQHPLDELAILLQARKLVDPEVGPNVRVIEVGQAPVKARIKRVGELA